MATSCVVEAHREVNDEDRVASYTLEEMDGDHFTHPLFSLPQRN